MTARDDLDLVLREWFAATAHVVEPLELHEAAVGRIRSARQMPRWLARPRGGYPVHDRGLLRPAFLLGVLAALTGAALVAGILPAGFLRQVPDREPAPSHSQPQASSTSSPSQPEASRATPTDAEVPEPAPSFSQPFDYVIPPGSGLVPAADGPHPNRIAWVVGTETTGEDLIYGGQAEGSGVDRGILVATATRPWAHAETGRYYLRTAPADLLEDLTLVSGAAHRPITPVNLGGRPALAMVITQYGQNDIHLVGGISGFATADTFGLGNPSQLIVADVDGQVVFVTAWAWSESDLDAFLPTANQFVDSIRFHDPVPNGSPGQARTFSQPFNYVIPDGSGLRLAEGGPHPSLIGWIDGPDLGVPQSDARAYGGQRSGRNVGGILVGLGGNASSHSSTGRFQLGREPAEFLASLGDAQHVDVGPISESLVDGRPALTASVVATGYNDIHVGVPGGGLGIAPYTQLTVPSRLTVTVVDGETVFIQIWGRSPANLDALLPTATRFVESMRFTGP